MSSVNLNLSSEEAKKLLFFYQARYRELWASVPEYLRERLEELDKLIKSLSSQLGEVDLMMFVEPHFYPLQTNLNSSFLAPPDLTAYSVENYHIPYQYDKDASRYANTLWVLGRFNRLVTTRQIIETWLSVDPKLLDREGVTMGQMQGKLSSTLKQKVDAEVVLDRIQPDFYDEYFYGFKDWFDGTGNPKPEFIPSNVTRELFVNKKEY